MDELLGRLAANVGIDRETAEKSVAIILDFLRKEGPGDQVAALFGKLPGAEGLLQAQSGVLGGGMFDMGGVMGAGSKLMAAGLDMGQVQAVTKEVIAYVREKADSKALDQIVAAIPGLSQFV